MGREEGKTSQYDLVSVQSTLAVVSLFAGMLLSFVPDINAELVCQVLCSLTVVAGLISAVRFFVSEDYLDFESLGFAEGVLMLLLGCAGLARIEGVTAGLATCLGVLVLILSAIALQQALQLRAIGARGWVVALLVALAFGASGIVVCADVRAVLDSTPNLPAWSAFACGLVSLVVMVYVFMCLRKRGMRAQEAADAQDVSTQVASGQDDGAELATLDDVETMGDDYDA